ncbi:histone-binding protein N1/N2-like isoform X2 [Dunckerocampus dactyliophorus]|uniref:histone-binding protein N1/N2-like isoform X2 n=1 Tax=Dunckerocampus dactyliophorus TaxID=161453 RepID=UPI002406F5D3|nr:histone-binding protein N1/N2-like isoform X2 [Dunckerocampus dactyliophorus]
MSHRAPRISFPSRYPHSQVNMEDANKLIGAGKKHLVMGKVVEAVSTLQEACGMLAKKYGDTADECAEAFFWCGKALLDMARMENSVLGNALEGVPEDDEDKPKDSNFEGTENVDEKTRDELRVQVYEAMAEKPEDAQKNKGNKKEAAEKMEEELSEKKVGEQPAEEEAQPEDQKAAEKRVEESAQKEAQPEDKKTEPSDKEAQPEDTKAADKKVEEPPSDKKEEQAEDKDVRDDAAADKNVEEPSDNMEEEPANGEEEDAEDGDEDDAEEQGEENNAGEKESDDEDEVGNLQLAWEMLEVAKVIYKRKEAKEDQLMAAQTHLKLGEVSAETGNYTQALEDFQECLKLQLKHLDSDSRLLAETRYQLGLTFSLNMQYKEAIAELNSSISVIKSRLEKLTELIQNAAGPEELPEERKEMEELKALLPEIQEKVEDATDGLKTGRADAEAVKGVLDGASTSSAFPASTGEHGSACTASESNGASTAKAGSANGAAAKAPVSDISHLVRKKRKPEESPVKEGVKKVKQESDGDCVHKANGDANGHANSMEVESQ